MHCPLRSRSLTNPESFFFKSFSETVSFQAADKRVSSISEAITSLGLVKGDTVGILLEGGVDFFYLFLVCNRLGLRVVPLNLFLTPEDWKSHIELAEAELVISAGSCLEEASQLGIKVLDLEAIEEKVQQGKLEEIELDLDAEAFVFFSSGSSGSPKAVVLTLRNFYSNAEGSNQVTGLSSEDTWLLSLAPFHAGGAGILYRCLLAGSSLFLLDPVSTSNISKAIKEEELSFLSLIPTMLEQFIEDDELVLKLKKMKIILLSGAPSSENLLEQIKKLELPVLSCYGMTETAAHCVSNDLKNRFSKLHTVGKPLTKTKLAVLDSEGRECEVGVAGMIAFSGESLFSSYLGAEYSKSAFMQGEWFLTGDNGVLDSDSYLSVLGRADSMLISGGINLYPKEIEDVVKTYQQVALCAVVSIKDEKWGERPVLFVEPKSSDNFSKAALEEIIKKRLAPIKQPDRIILIDKIPLTAIGKVDYSELRNRLTEVIV